MDFIKRYTITLEAIGPVYIGSGRKMLKKEWILDWDRKLAIIPDDRKFFRFLQERGLMKAYEDYMLGPNIPLDRWLEQKKIGRREIDKIAGYALDAGCVIHLNQQTEINMFVKDGYGLPYVPGSSLKGALRNVILARMITEKGLGPKILSDIRKEINESKEFNKRRFLKQSADKIEQEFFYTRELPDTRTSDAVNDTLRGIRISDSKPLALSDLTLCQKVDNPVEGQENNLNLLRESLKPGTVIEAEMTIDATETKLSAEYITAAIDSFLQQYNEMFLKHFKDEELYRQDVLYLGGGVGMASKTVLNQTLQTDKNRVELVSKVIDRTLNNTNINRHKHFRDSRLGVSPHMVKLTEFNGKLCQFGPCRITITPV